MWWCRPRWNATMRAASDTCTESCECVLTAHPIVSTITGSESKPNLQYYEYNGTKKRTHMYRFGSDGNLICVQRRWCSFSRQRPTLSVILRQILLRSTKWPMHCVTSWVNYEESTNRSQSSQWEDIAQHWSRKLVKVSWHNRLHLLGGSTLCSTSFTMQIT